MNAIKNIAAAMAHPLVIKEFRTAFRRWRFVSSHVLVLLGVYVVLFIYIVDLSNLAWSNLSMIGPELFGIFALGLFIGISLLLIPLSALSLVTEKDQLTYDLLTSTTLSPASIVWGKFLSCMGYAVVYVLTALPFAIIPFLIGGITLDVILIYFVVVLFWAAMVNITGIFASSICRTAAQSIIVTFVITGGLALLAGGYIEYLLYRTRYYYY